MRFFAATVNLEPSNRLSASGARNKRDEEEEEESGSFVSDRAPLCFFRTERREKLGSTARKIRKSFPLSFRTGRKISSDSK